MYLADLMEDAQDFSWASAKAAHAVAQCRMEDGKLTWKDTQGLDRVRRAHAKKILGIQIDTMEQTAVNLTKVKNWDLFVIFFKLGPAITRKTIQVGAENIDTYVRMVRVSIQQKIIRPVKKSQKTSKALVVGPEDYVSTFGTPIGRGNGGLSKQSLSGLLGA